MLLAIDYAFIITIDKSGAGRNFCYWARIKKFIIF
jgi:hypothetical protein